ncbi:hypothetical protein PZA11_004467 [Diplocarpon coronariae]
MRSVYSIALLCSLAIGSLAQSSGSNCELKSVDCSSDKDCTKKQPQVCPAGTKVQAGMPCYNRDISDTVKPGTKGLYFAAFCSCCKS